MVEGEEGIEVIGRTLDEAVQKGLEHLQLNRDQVEVEILSDGARTLLGFRPGQARVRLTPKRTRTPRPAQPAREQQKAPAAPSETKPVPTPAPEPEVEAEEEAQALTGDDITDVSSRILQELLRRMGMRGARVAVEQPAAGDEPLRLNVVGRDLGVLIGRRGETLSAIQFLTRMMASHQLERWVNLVVDVDGYRKKREEALSRLAVRLAEQAVETGRPQEMEPMPASERRIVHIALRDFDGVRTESSGEGDSRRVNVIPTKNH